MQIKTTMKCHFTLVGKPITQKIMIINVGEVVEKLEPLYIVSGDVKRYSRYGKQCDTSSTNSK